MLIPLELNGNSEAGYLFRPACCRNRASHQNRLKEQAKSCMGKALNAAATPGKGIGLYFRSAFRVFKTQQPIPRLLLECGTMVKESLCIRKCPCAEEKILKVLLAILLPRANPLKVVLFQLPACTSCAPAQLSDLPNLGETFTPGSLPSLSLQPRQDLLCLQDLLFSWSSASALPGEVGAL